MEIFWPHNFFSYFDRVFDPEYSGDNNFEQKQIFVVLQ